MGFKLQKMLHYLQLQPLLSLKKDMCAEFSPLAFFPTSKFPFSSKSLSIHNTSESHLGTANW